MLSGLLKEMLLATRKRKVRHQRGSRTHGWGTSGQHRGSGMLGGHGRAGRYRGKRSRLIRTKEFFDMRYAGKKGFMSVAQKRGSERAMNLIQLMRLVDTLTRENKLQMENNVPVVDLRELGYAKLLGTGSISQAVRVKVGRCSESALRKLKEAGGDAMTEKTSEN
jgi:large subunit ribosomal protein L15